MTTTPVMWFRARHHCALAAAIALWWTIASAADPAIEIDTQQCEAHARDVTLVIRATSGTKTSHGAAVVVTANGVALTARHVIAGASRITAAFNDGKVVPVSVLYQDAQWDLAILQCDVAAPVARAFVAGVLPQNYNRTYLVVGNPGGKGRTAQPAKLSKDKRVNVSWFGTKQALAMVDGPLDSGYSGGGFFDLATGTLRGIIVAKSLSKDGHGYVVPTSDYLRFWMRNIQIGDHPDVFQALRISWAFGFWAAEVPLKGGKYRSGLFITKTLRGAQADKNGWREGDLLVGLDRYRTEIKDHVVYALEQVEKDAQKTQAILVRDGKEFRTAATIAPRERFDIGQFAPAEIGRILRYDEYRLAQSTGSEAGAAVSEVTDAEPADLSPPVLVKLKERQKELQTRPLSKPPLLETP